MKKTLIWIAVIIVLAIAAYYAYKAGWFAKLTGQRTVGSAGSEPSDECGSNVGRVSACTAPIYQKAGATKEWCWTFEQLGFEPMPGDTITPPPYNKKWYYNKQNGSQYCFVDNRSFLTEYGQTVVQA